MKTLWTFTALVLATLYHGSHQKPSQPSQSSSKSEYYNFVGVFFISKKFGKKFHLNTLLILQMSIEKLGNLELDALYFFKFWTKKFDI